MPGPAWLVLPTYDEAENLEAIVRAARAALPDLHVLVVDDDSPDGTGRIADRLAEEDPAHVAVLHRARREGLGRAYLAGFDAVLARGAGFVFEMDADFSHDPNVLPRLLERARDGADVVIGSRYVEGGRIADWGPLRRGISRGGCWYARVLLRMPVRDLTSGFKCFRAGALRALDLPTVRSEGYAFQVELTYRAHLRGMRIEELPITFRDREKGRSKMSARIAVEAAWMVPALRRATRRAPAPAGAEATAPAPPR